MHGTGLPLAGIALRTLVVNRDDSVRYGRPILGEEDHGRFDERKKSNVESNFRNGIREDLKGYRYKRPKLMHSFCIIDVKVHIHERLV